MRQGILAISRLRGRAALAAALLPFALAACVGPAAPGPKTQLGAAGGAAAGGLLGAALGNEPEGIIAGVLLGGLLGGAIGNALDDADREYAMRTSYYALERTPSGATSSWHNPDTGHSGTLTPLRTFESGRGGYCREFQQTVRIGGRSQRAYGTACREPDGSWRIVQ
jgi:surface antigen